MSENTELNKTTEGNETLKDESEFTPVEGDKVPVETDPGFAKPDPEKNGASLKVEPIPPIQPKSKNRLTITLNFSLDEVPYINEIIKARVDSKLSKNPSHFIRQCVDFAIHHVPGTKMAIPQIPPVEIKDGFYNPSK